MLTLIKLAPYFIAATLVIGSVYALSLWMYDAGKLHERAAWLGKELKEKEAQAQMMHSKTQQIDKLTFDHEVNIARIIDENNKNIDAINDAVISRMYVNTQDNCDSDAVPKADRDPSDIASRFSRAELSPQATRHIRADYMIAEELHAAYLACKGVVGQANVVVVK